jgi:hypothetical protein
MKAWLMTNQAFDPTGPLDAEGGLVLPVAYRSVRMHELANPEATRQTLRRAVQAYARDPSERNAVMVEAAVEALRRQRTGSRS